MALQHIVSSIALGSMSIDSHSPIVNVGAMSIDSAKTKKKNENKN